MDPPSGSLTPGEIGNPYSQQIILSENTYEIAQFQFKVPEGALPPGLHITEKGYSTTISGTPTELGDYSFSLTVNAGACVVDQA